MTGLSSLVVALAAVGGAPDGVLLDFSSSSCGPCQAMMPAVHRLQKQGYAIRTVDVDREPALSQRFGISHVPTFVLVVKGQEQQRYTGTLSEAQLRRMASMICVGSLTCSSHFVTWVYPRAAENMCGQPSRSRL